MAKCNLLSLLLGDVISKFSRQSLKTMFDYNACIYIAVVRTKRQTCLKCGAQGKGVCPCQGHYPPLPRRSGDIFGSGGTSSLGK